MADAFDQTGPRADASAIGRWNSAFANAAKAAPPLLYALRLWAAMCLALFVAFWLELDNPFWAGTSAAIVCQLQLGASLRKGWFRMIGTVVGATMIVVLTACFPQDRIAFLVLLAFWCSICAFAATVFRNFASYSAALAGYTAAIIAADNLGATGGASSDVFLLAVTRASEICIGIACAGIVLAGTDLGGAQRRLAGSFANLAAEIMGRFIRMLDLAEPQLPDTKAERREFVRRVIALDPVIDQALGESSHVRYHSSKLQTAMYGLFGALDGWRGVATHLSRLPEAARRQGAHIILRSLPSELRSVPEAASPLLWIADPLALRGVCEEAVRTLIALPADTPSLRLLADETAKVLAGMLHVLDGLALLVDAPDQPSPRAPRFRLSEPDWLPALTQCGTRISRYRCCRAFLGRDRLAKRRLGDRIRSGLGSVAFAERRSCLRRSSRIRAGHRWRRSLRGGLQIRDVACAANVPGLLRRLGSLPHTSRLCNSREPATNSDHRPDRHDVQLQPSPRAHQRDELRHRTILQFRACNRRGLRRGTAGISPVASVVAGPSSASPSRLDLS